MKKFFTLMLTIGALLCGQSAMAGGNSTVYTYHAKASIQVDEECSGLGTVYFLDENEQPVSEKTIAQSGSGEFGDSPQGRTLSFDFTYTSQEGYDLASITDAEGKEAEFEILGSNRGRVNVYAMSIDPENPDVFTFYAHFSNTADAVLEVTTAEKFCTFVCPIDAELPEGIRAYVVTNAKEDGTVTLQEVAVTTIPANTPVLIENTTTQDIKATYTYPLTLEKPEAPTQGLLVGTYTRVSLNNPSDFIMYNYEDSHFFYGTAGFTSYTVDPYEAYLHVEGVPEEVQEFLFTTPIATGINGVAQQDGQVRIYDVNGRQINKLQKGINIVNGMKVLVK